MKKQETWLARIKHLLGYKNTDDVPLDTLLENTMSYYENIIGCMPGNVYWTDKNCIAVGCNQNVLNMLGLTLSQFQGLSFEEMGEIAGWSDSTTASFKHDTLEVIQTGQHKLNVEEPPIIDLDGNSIVFLTHRVPLFDKQKNIVGAVGISINITDRKKMEISLRDEKIKSVAANHAKTEFLANMSHDIRTPLTGITGLSKLIEDNATDPTQRDYAHFLGQSGDELLHMLNGILDVVSADNANESDVHEEPFDLRHIIEEILHLERPTTLVKGIDLLTTVDERVPPCFIGDHTKLHRILLNLLGNAIKFTQHGHVQVNVMLIKDEGSHTNVRFQVSDTGIGIPLEMQDKVFDRFFRVSPSYRGIYTGHGVGLHIAQSYTHLLGGEIDLTSEPCVGTTFSFELRLKKGDATLLPFHSNNISDTIKSAPTSRLSNSVPVNVASLPDNAPHLLLVEDNPIALLVLSQLVTHAGCKIATAVDGVIAYGLATTESFDLIITDIGLPHCTGTEFTARLRAFEASHQMPSVPIIGLTAHADDASKQACLQSGMNEAHTKPMNANLLEQIKTTYLSVNGATISPQQHSKPNPAGGKLGLDLPDTEAQLFLLDAFSLLDAKHALKSMANDAELLRAVLASMVEKELPNDLKELDALHDASDWESIEKLAHRMKGGLVYCGTNRLVHACQYLERYRKAGHSKSLEGLYQQLRQVAAHTMDAIHAWLSR